MRLIIALFLGWMAFDVSAAESACSSSGAFRNANGCMPVVFVVRHAEDTASGPHALTAEGTKHAELYIRLFNDYIWGDTHSIGKDKSPACVCPVGKIISISDKGGDVSPRNPNPNPSSNPYQTILKVSESLGIPITTDNGETQYWSSFQWNADAKKKLFDYSGNQAQFSVIIAWDKQGLNPTAEDYAKLVTWLSSPESKISYKDFTPLLKNFPNKLPADGSFALDPSRTTLWVYSDQNEEGKFVNMRVYQQVFYKKDCTSDPSWAPKLDSECIIPQQRSY
ncbi:hypothetical protein B1207_11470 [Legionella quinlivanii]|uniref:Histidine phosphatase family protein n=1 Tax=Legionella quinlivanii TaxID=45073 RepID=A0A364LHE6_9GAMM|nr:hypothetical protein [Legionella quinlivanii]RAP35700.1 hypothetical protein B1207_11470 [Legionella quinlivanii]